MNTVLALASAALAVLAVLLSRRRPSPEKPPETGGYAIAAILCAALGLGAFFAAPPDMLPSIASALAIGLVASIVATATQAAGLAGLAIGLTAVAAASFLPFARPVAAVGLALGAVALANEGAAIATLAAVAILAGNALGVKAGSDPALASAGTLIGIATVVAGLVASALDNEKLRRAAPLVAAALVAVAATGLLKGYLHLDDDIPVVIGASLAALVVYALLNDAEGDPLRMGIAALVWVGLATVAYGFGRGLGMALALICAATILATLYRRASAPSALLSLLPLAALVLYRMIRDGQPISPPALEATQHNFLVGALLGVLVPLLPGDWLQSASSKRNVGLGLWGLVLVLVPVATLVLAGSRGIVGLMIGAGLAGPFAVSRRATSLMPLAFGLGMGVFAVAGYTWLKDLTVLERSTRIWVGGGIAILAALIGLALFAITPRPTSRPTLVEEKA